MKALSIGSTAKTALGLISTGLSLCPASVWAASGNVMPCTWPVLAAALICIVFAAILFRLAPLSKSLAGATSPFDPALKTIDVMLENIPGMVQLKDAKGLGFVGMNKAAAEFFGLNGQDPAGKTVYDFCPADNAVEISAADSRAVQSGETVEIQEEKVVSRASGLRILHTKRIPIPDESGAPRYLLVIADAITDLPSQKRALRETESRLRHLSDNLPSGMVYQIDSGADGRTRKFTYLSAGVEHLHGITAEEAMSDPSLIYGQVHEDDLNRLAAAEARAFRLMEPFQGEVRICMPDGSLRWSLFASAPSINADGHVVWDGLEIDISEKKLAEEKLRDTNELLELVFNMSYSIIAYLDTDFNFIRVSLSYAAADGKEPGFFPGKNHFDLFPNEENKAIFSSVVKTGEPYVVYEKPFKYENNPERGTTYWDWALQPVRGRHGAIKGLILILQDVTQHKVAMEEKNLLEQRLIQSQKMEAIGALAGGVAHDFNNMLSVIIGNSELALTEEGLTPSVKGLVEQILNAGKRSAAITRQLLAFARKQIISPRVMDVDEAVAPMLKILKRLIGEDIELTWIPGSGGRKINIDPSQLDQILANLATNARNAIAGVGKVKVQTGHENFDLGCCDGNPEFLEGEYVIISFTDSGHGIEKELIPKIFEPFFTTQPFGKGTGLGLATVYGIVRQNKGIIKVDSEIGVGTTFRIYLPCSQGAQELESKTASKPKGGSETVLLVEDEEMNLQVMSQMLENLGYTVLATADPIKAVGIANTHQGKIDIVVTDVVMPGMNGRDLVMTLTEKRPGIRHLFISGYTAGIIEERGILSDKDNFLQKPYTIHDLAAKVRHSLG